MRKVNKYFVFIVVGLLCFTFCTKNTSAQEYVNYNGIHMTEEEYNTLLNLGFTKNQVVTVSVIDKEKPKITLKGGDKLEVFLNNEFES